MTVEASLQLSRSYGEMAKREPDSNKRTTLFNAAVVAMTKARKYDKSAGFRARSDVVIAGLLLLKADAETEFGTPEKATEYRGSAISTLQGLMMLGDPNDLTARPHIEDAFALCLPLLLDAEHWQAALDDCDNYLETFGNKGRFVSEVRRVRSKAKTKLAMSGVEVTVGAEDSDEEAEEAVEAPAVPAPADAEATAEGAAPAPANGTGEQL